MTKVQQTDWHEGLYRGLFVTKVGNQISETIIGAASWRQPTIQSCVYYAEFVNYKLLHAYYVVNIQLVCTEIFEERCIVSWYSFKHPKNSYLYSMFQIIFWT